MYVLNSLLKYYFILFHIILKMLHVCNVFSHNIKELDEGIKDKNICLNRIKQIFGNIMEYNRQSIFLI